MTKAPPSPDALMAALDHPLKAQAEALRSMIRAIKAPALEESVKWNTPSFSVGGTHCLTFNFGDRKSIRLIFHCDTARKETKGAAPAFEDPLLAWQSDIRAIATFRSMEEVAAVEKALPALVKRWVAEVLGG